MLYLISLLRVSGDFESHVVAVIVLLFEFCDSLDFHVKCEIGRKSHEKQDEKIQLVNLLYPQKELI